MLLVYAYPVAMARGDEERTAVEQEQVDRGKRFYEAGQYEEARRIFQDLLKGQPDRWEAVYYLELIDKTIQREARITEAMKLAELRMRRAQYAAGETPRASPWSETAPKPLTEESPASLKLRRDLSEARRAKEGERTAPEAGRGPEIASTSEVSASETPPSPSPPPTENEEAAPPRPKVGDATLLVDGVEVTLEQPILLRDGRPLLPLRDVAAARYVSLVQLPDGKFRLVFPDGVTKELAATLMEQEPMLTEEQVRDVFSVDTSYDPAARIVSLRSPQPTAFQTSTIAKSEEELREEERIQTLAARAKQPPEPTGEIPEAARPDVQLHGTVSYAYRDPHIGGPNRSLVTSVTGHAYDFDVRGELSRKDRNGVFRHDYNYLNFIRPDLFIGLFDQSTSLAPLRGQSERFNGAKVIKTWNPRLETTFLGGSTENTVSGPSGSVKYLGWLYEADQQIALWEWLQVREALLYLENRADLPSQSGTTDFPREDLVSMTDVTAQPFDDWTFSGQIANSTYRPDNLPKDTVSDVDWRASSVFKKERYALGAAYEFVGDRYASIGDPAVYRDYKGWNFFGNYRLTNAWSVSSTLLRYRNNVDDDPTKITLENQALLVSSSYQLPWHHTATLTWDTFLTNPSGPNPGSSNRTDLYRLDYGLPFWFGTQLLLDVQHTGVHQPSGSGSSSDATGGSLFKGFEGGSSVYLSQQFSRSNFKASADTFTSTTSLNANYQASRDLGLTFSSAYTRQAQEASKTSNTLSGSTGVRWQVTPTTTFTSEYRVDSYDIEREHGRWPRLWSIFFLVTKSFDVSTPPAFATIEGRVVQDLNGNGLIDPGEPGIEDVAVHLADGRQTTTTPEGSFGFLRVVPGRQTVAVDPASLPPALALQTPEQTVEVRRRGRATVLFPVVKAASIRGRVFIDANGDGIFQETEEPLEGIAVVLSTSGQFRRTNSDGSFLFDHLLPGSYTMVLQQQDLPVGYALMSENAITITVKAGEDVKEIPFAVRLLPEPSSRSL